MGVEVGQKLWLVRGGGALHRDRPHEREVTVTKVGRKWFYVEHPDYIWCKQERYDIESMVEDDGQYTSNARCYLSKVDYDNQVAIGEKWDLINLWMRKHHKCPDEVTIDKLNQVAGILGIPENFS